jgi:hypothetical protein
MLIDISFNGMLRVLGGQDWGAVRVMGYDVRDYVPTEMAMRTRS